MRYLPRQLHIQSFFLPSTLIASLLCSACSAIDGTLASSLDASPYRSSQVAVLPDERARPVVFFPLLEVPGKDIPDEVLVTINELFKKSIENRGLVGPSENGSGNDLQDKALKNVRQSSLPLHRQAALYGELTGARSVLYGMINSYGNESGRSARELAKAAAGFSLWLIQSGSGRILWKCTYANFNQPLSENLLRIPEVAEQGLAYHTSLELMTYGLDRAANDLGALFTVDRKNPAQRK